MEQQAYYKPYFEKKDLEEIQAWVTFNKKQLVGSAIFTKGTNLGASIVVWAEGWKCKKGFKPSHTGSIIEKDGEIYIFDMKPPRASIQRLDEYILNTDEEFIILLRDFDLDTKMFSLNMLDHVGQGYPYMSAIKSVFSKRQSKWNNHCSELHLRQLQLQGLFINLNAEITPDELLHAMVGEG